MSFSHTEFCIYCNMHVPNYFAASDYEVYKCSTRLFLVIVVGFEQDVYEVTEGTPEVVIILEVLNGTIGEGVQVPVNLTTEDDTATSCKLSAMHKLYTQCN